MTHIILKCRTAPVNFFTAVISRPSLASTTRSFSQGVTRNTTRERRHAVTYLFQTKTIDLWVVPMSKDDKFCHTSLVYENSDMPEISRLPFSDKFCLFFFQAFYFKREMRVCSVTSYLLRTRNIAVAAWSGSNRLFLSATTTNLYIIFQYSRS